MRKKVSKSEICLLGLTAAFVCVLLGMAYADRPTGEPGTYTVTTEREAQVEVTPEARYINVNTATAEELTELPGVGEVIAGRIVDYRTANGPFTTVEQLLEVKGIGEAKLSQMRGSLTLDGTPPERSETIG